MQNSNLYDKFMALNGCRDNNAFNVISLEEMPHKLGMSQERFPMFFVRTNSSSGIIQNSIRELLSVEYNVECQVVENNGDKIEYIFGTILGRETSCTEKDKEHKQCVSLYALHCRLSY